MKSIASHALLCTLLLVGRAEAQQPTVPNTPAAKRPAALLGHLEVGQQVVLAEVLGGYYLALGPSIPPWLAVRSMLNELQQAEAQQQVVEAEYQRAVAANQRVPNTFSEQDVERLRTQLAMHNQHVEQARKNATRPVQWELFAIGDDHVGLRNQGSELYVPLTSIRAVVRHTPPASEQTPPR